MGYSHERIKSNARLFYHNNLSGAILVPFLTMAISSFAFSVIYGMEFFFINIGVLTHGILNSTSDLFESRTISAEPYVLSTFSGVFVYGVMFFGTMILPIGSASWFRKSISKKCDYGELFSGFKVTYLRNVGTMALKTLYIFLWSMLLLIPGIVKTYSYSMTEYIRGEFPQLSASDSIRLSMDITSGHKGKLFYLDLSFWGWFILSAFTFNILSIVYVLPYYNAAKAFAYEELKADAVLNGKLLSYNIQQM